MWHDDLKEEQSWTSLWSDHILCACSGIRRVTHCPACGSGPLDTAPFEVDGANGQKMLVVSAFAGADGRYEDYVFLAMLEREWKRPLLDDDYFPNISSSHRPNARAAIGIIFWTYFESRIDRLLRHAMRSLPDAITMEILGRHSSISSRMERIWKILFRSTYWKDLEDLGFGDVGVLLKRVRDSRNLFVHGHPEAIDSTMVVDLVDGLKREHEGWIAVFNLRAAPAGLS